MESVGRERSERKVRIEKKKTMVNMVTLTLMTGSKTGVEITPNFLVVSRTT